MSTMNTINRDYLRIAQQIQMQLLKKPDNCSTVSLPEEQWSRLKATRESMSLAQSRGWQYAARCRQEQILSEIDELYRVLRRQAEQLRTCLIPQSVATLIDLYQDLIALESEFPEVQCDMAAHLLRVTTRPIVLENIDLGPFQICLDLQRSRETQTYRVIALEPQPAQSNPEVTHPHVSEETLCEGDGRRAISSALAAGRLYDFFTIVDRLLNTYASGRAYVDLDHWYGIPCHDCGQTVGEDERYCCNHCEEILCSDCSTFCGHCENLYCSNCGSSCELCDRLCCSSCLESCQSCGSLICSDCLTQNLCTQCHENQFEEDKAEAVETCVSTKPPLALHPDLVGQVTLPT
jgi:hypothetical protein